MSAKAKANRSKAKRVKDASATAFEQLNQRIRKLVLGDGAKVEWSAKIPDPDSGNLRQIDVLITAADGKRSSVECREHKATQSVKWVEELIGRKESLNLDGMIAVAVKGYSKPAAKKAARFNIVLYDFSTLTDAEIASWGGVVQVESVFVQFKSLQIEAGIAKGTETQLHPDVAKTVFARGDMDGFAAVMDLLRDDVAGHPGMPRSCVLDPRGFTVDGLPLTALQCKFEGLLVPKSASCTYVAMVDEPGVARALRSVEVQRFEHSVTEVLLHAGEAHLLLDFSALPVPDNSILHELRTKFPRPPNEVRYELLGNRRFISVADGNIHLDIGTTD